jgi:hypothetical protein
VIVIWIGCVTGVINLNSSSDNSHTRTLEELMDGDSSLIKNTVYVMTAMNGMVLISHSVNHLFHNCGMTLHKLYIFVVIITKNIILYTTNLIHTLFSLSLLFRFKALTCFGHHSPSSGGTTQTQFC